MSLIELVRSANVPAVVEELAELSPAQRRACLPELKALRKELRADWWTRDDRQRSALLIAGAGCHTSASAAAAWLGGRDFTGSAAWKDPALLTVVESRPLEWQTTVAERLAERRAPSWGWSDEFPLIEYLVRTTACPVPTSDAFVIQWFRDRSWPHERPAHLPGGVVGHSLWERLSGDPLLPVMVPRLFEIADFGSDLDGPWGEKDPERRWIGCLTLLTEQGVLGRDEMIDRCLARLLRGGRLNDQRSFLKLLQALAPTDAEDLAQARSYLALLDGPSTIAAHAQGVLAELDDAGVLAPDLLGEASVTVLFRTEKKLVRSQLGWLDRAARRDRARAGEVVLAAAGAFGHPDLDLQDRALKVIIRHLAAAGDGVLPELRSAAEALNPAHRLRAGELFGAEQSVEVHVELLPPVPEPRPLPGPLGSPAEVAEEISAILLGDTEVPVFERALDGLVRHAYLHRSALAEALAPVLRVQQWRAWPDWSDCTPRDIHYVAEVAAGSVAQVQAVVKGQSPLRGRRTSLFGAQLAARLEEAAGQVLSGPPPFLLATPTLATGALDAEVLVERLAEYERLEVAPGQVDLGQALLRAVPTPAALAAAERLRSAAGQRLARWLREGGLPHQESVAVRPPADEEERKSRHLFHRWRSTARRIVEHSGAALADPLPTDAALLVGPQSASMKAARGSWTAQPSPHWVAMLPGHREEVAARLLGSFAEAADSDERGAPQQLPYLAEAGGPAGPAVHLAVAYGLGARFAEDRAAAVDALLVLAARGDLDGGLLGRELAELVRSGVVKPNRLSQSLRAAADTGAYGTVWSVLAGALPGLLTGEPVRGGAELLAVAADCARRSSARGPIAEVVETAGRGTASRLVKEAKALQEVLAGL